MCRSGLALGFKIGRPAVAVAGLLLSGVAFAPYAQARVSCSYSGPPTNVLTVRGGILDGAEVSRNGSEIVVRRVLGPAVSCAGGTPTVLNTDTIRAPAENLDFLLDGGPFAPGATLETEGVPEIEIRASGPEAQVNVVGTSGEDHFHWGAGGAHAGLNLNPGNGGDEDVDVTVAGIGAFLLAQGAAGNDTIIPAPGGVGRGDGILSLGGDGDDLLSAKTTHGLVDGGAGDDSLIGGRLGAEFRGGGGNDRIDGGSGRDWIAGGPGQDLLSGGRGRDRINSRDTQRDRVRCGPGRDRVKADQRDRLRGCELSSRR